MIKFKDLKFILKDVKFLLGISIGFNLALYFYILYKTYFLNKL